MTSLRPLAAVMLLLAGCSGAGTSDFYEDVDTRSQDLRCHDGYGNPINDANCPWKYLARQTPSDPNNDISHRKDPALCAAGTGLTISVDTNNRYRTLQWHWFGAPSWGSYGPRTFASKPACTLREDAASGQNGFVLAGKGTDNKIYASPGIMAPGASPQGNPTPAGPFTAVSNTTYSTGGSPALATGGVGSQSVVMVFMGDDRRTIYAHARRLPYMQNDWSERITGPQLPANWVAVGAPSIARLPITLPIVVHARHRFTGEDRVFETHFFAYSEHFSSGIGSPDPSWTMLPSVGPIDGDVALTSSEARGSDVYGNDLDLHGLTLYFRSGNQIMQTSGYPLGQNAPLPVMPSAQVQFASSPAAVANWAFESQNGTHTVIARTTSNQLYVGTTMMDYSIVP